MNKKILLLLLFIPFIVSAKCDSDKHEEYLKLSSNITYDNNYSKSEGNFNIIIYNIFDGMYVEDKSGKYTPDEENKVTVTGVKPGSTASLSIYADDGCEEIKVITIIEPYFNAYYNTSVCYGYEDKIPVCASQFTSSKVTRELVDLAKENYDNSIPQVDNKQEEKKDNGILARLKNFIDKWGIKILLVAVTIFISVSLYSTKVRKIKHGI